VQKPTILTTSLTNVEKNEAILRSRSDGVKKEKGTIESGFTVVLEANMTAEKSLLLE